MQSKIVKMPGGVTAIVCGRFKDNPPCKWCGKRGTKQCDFPVSRAGIMSVGQACDAWMCDRCAVSVGENRDYCPPHFRHAQKEAQKILSGGKDDETPPAA